MSENVNIKHIEDNVGAIGNTQICIEPGNDTQTGHRMWAGKDGAGNTYKFLGKGKPAFVENLNVSDFTTAGLLRTDASGDIYGDVNSLGELNTVLGGTTIDESTDPRDPNAHAIAGSDHTASTLSEFNSKISDATLDDSGDPRTPIQHAIGSSTYHSSSTISELNALISDANVDDENDPRPPTAHAGSHESGGADAIDHDSMTLNVDPAYQHYKASPTIGQLGWSVTDTVITGSTSNLSTSMRALTSMYTKTLSTTGWQQIAAGEKYIFAYFATTYDLVDRITGSTIVAGGTFSTGQAGTTFYRDNIISTSSAVLRTTNPLTGATSVLASGTFGTVTDIKVNKISGNIYFMNTTGSLFIYGPTGTLVYSGAISGFSNSPCAIYVDDSETYLYALDMEYTFSAGPDAYVRRITLSSKTITMSSSASPANAGVYSSMDTFDGHLVVALPRTALTNHQMWYLSFADLSTKYLGASTIVTVQGSYYGGMFYGCAASTLTTYQLPGLTNRSKALLDLYWKGGIIEIPDAGVRMSPVDFGKMKLSTDSMLRDQCGVTVKSVVTAAPGSPSIGDTHLVTGGTGQYNDYVIRRTALGTWDIFARSKGNRVTDDATGAVYDWTGSAWQQVGVLTAVQKTDLTDGGDSTAHYHAADRSRANHTGTQTASTVSDFTEAAQDAVGAMVSSEFTYTDATPSLALNFANIPHNSTASKQGGTTNEYYHLTSANHSALTGGPSTSVPHQHLETIRDVSVSGTLTSTDAWNIVRVLGSRTAAVSLTLAASLTSMTNGTKFSVVCEYNGTYGASINFSGGTVTYDLNLEWPPSSGLGYYRFNFTLIGGIPIPESSPSITVSGA